MVGKQEAATKVRFLRRRQKLQYLPELPAKSSGDQLTLAETRVGATQQYMALDGQGFAGLLNP
jgi:hypothetical protein